MIRRGPAGAGGWRTLQHLPDDEVLAQTSGVSTLATLIHTSDWHLCDVASSARLEYLDRYFDPDHPHRLVVGPVGTYRPQEFLTRHVADQTVRAINQVRKGPSWGRAVDAVVMTGDLIDNAQANELADLVSVVTGGELEATDVNHWVGSLHTEWDEHYWHPEGKTPDRPRSLFGFPQVPGLLDAAARRFTTPGLDHRFVAIHGNHDALLQGTVAAERELTELLRRGHRITGIAPGTTPQDIVHALAQVGPARYIHDDAFPRISVLGSNSERFVEPGEFRGVLGGLPGSLGGRGSAGAQYFTAEVGEVVVVSLDTVNPHGGYHGSIDVEQLQWLEHTLHDLHGRWVVLASHHPPRTLVNDYAPEGASRRLLAQDVLDVAFRAGNVMVWLTGHEHQNFVTQHTDEDGRVIPEIGTSSLIDWPQQSRIVELGVDRFGNRMISSRVIDHNGPAMPDDEIDSPATLASWSRLLAANDYQRRDPVASLDRSEGVIADRNFAWQLPPA